MIDKNHLAIFWCKTLPNHWEVERLRAVAHVRLSNVDKHIRDGEQECLLCNYVDVYKNESITPDMEFMAASASVDEVRKFQLREGQILLTKDSETPDDIGNPAYVSFSDHKLLCGYHLAQVTPDRKRLNGAFARYCLTSNLLNSQFKFTAKGVTRFAIGKAEISNFLIPLPPLEEQQKISEFLDSEMTKIAKQLATTISLKDLLEAAFEATISSAISALEAITRLRYTVIFNPSPQPIKHLGPDAEVQFAAMANVGEDGKIESNEVKTLGEVLGRYTFFQTGDVLIAKITPCFENGKGGVVPEILNGIGFGSTEFTVLRPTGILPEFLYFVTRSDWFRSKCEADMRGAAGQKRVPDVVIKDFVIPVPDKKAQMRIVQSIKDRLNDITNQIEIARDLEVHLAEKRAALITAAVTGQMEVS